MSWTYQQSTGDLSQLGILKGSGYSGCGEGKNNCAAEAIHDVGPIPTGQYTIESPRDTLEHGPYVLPLLPAASNEMHGRSGFLIHGDSIHAPGTASKGCVILPLWVRHRIWESGDHALVVMP